MILLPYIISLPEAISLGYSRVIHQRSHVSFIVKQPYRCHGRMHEKHASYTVAVKSQGAYVRQMLARYSVFPLKAVNHRVFMNLYALSLQLLLRIITLLLHIITF